MAIWRTHGKGCDLGWFGVVAVASGIAIRSNQIVAVGEDVGVTLYVGKATEVIDRDLTAIAPEEKIVTAAVQLTLVDGKRVYDASAPAPAASRAKARPQAAGTGRASPSRRRCWSRCGTCSTS